MLSPNFSEFELGVENVDPRIVQNAQALCETLLEPIRTHYSSPVHIHDGYRPPAHNDAVGGKPTSYHLFTNGKSAADIDVAGIGLAETFDWIRLESGLPFDKVILEHGADQIPRTVHIQYDRLAPPRRLAYTGQTGAGTSYQAQKVV